MALKKQTKETTLAGVLADENVLPGTITTKKTTYQAGDRERNIF